MSARTGLLQPAISQIESELKNPSKKSLEKICRALKLPETVLYILALEHSDVPSNKKTLFDELYPR
jgi:transcriptional regulator with XRE-family HTH domain